MEAKRFVLRKVAGENILVPVGNTALTFNGLGVSVETYGKKQDEGRAGTGGSARI